jgi:hypothetical protein
MNGPMRSAMLMASLAAAMLGAEQSIGIHGRPYPTREELEREKRLAEQRHKAILSKKGVQQFTIDGHTVYARDYKNAVRKVNNLKNPPTDLNYTDNMSRIIEEPKQHIHDNLVGELNEMSIRIKMWQDSTIRGVDENQVAAIRRFRSMNSEPKISEILDLIDRCRDEMNQCTKPYKIH